jgi:quinol monooxygenase YgiN
MITVSCILKAKPGKEKDLEQELRSMFPPSRNETGIVTYVLHRSVDDPGKFLFYEQYKDKESLDYHLLTPYFQSSSAKVNALLVEEPKAEFYEEVDAIHH